MLATLNSCLNWRETGLRAQNNVVSSTMPATGGVTLSPGDQKRINNGKKRKIRVAEWRDKSRKMSRDSGNPYISKRNKPVPGKLPPEMVSRTTLYLLYVWYQLTSDDPTTLRGRTAHNVLQPWKIHSLAKIIKDKKQEATTSTPKTSKKRTTQREVRRYPPVRVECFPRLYEDALPIKAAKKKDLLDICKYIPEEYKPFYEQIRVEEQE